MAEKLHYYLPISAGILLLIVGIVLGERYLLYDKIPYFDKILHLTGGVIVAWFFDYIFYEEISHMTSVKIILVLVACAALVGVLWEFAEYVSNFTRHTYPLIYHYFHGGDLADTMGDLRADILGAALLAIPLILKKKRN